MIIIGNILIVFVGGLGILAILFAVADAIIRQIEGEKQGSVEEVEVKSK